MLDHDSRQTVARNTVKGIRFSLAVIFATFGLAFLLIAVPEFFSHSHSHIQAQRVKCLNNLKQIGIALQIYASNNQGQFPRGIYNPTTADKPVAFTHASDNAGQLFAGNNAPVNDVTVSFLLLLQVGDLDPKVLICPRSNAIAWPTPSQIPGPLPKDTFAPFSNFPKSDYLSYSILNPYLKSDDPAARSAWAMQNTNPKHLTVIAADLNPGTQDLLTITPQSPESLMKKANSPNHDGTGQNVLFSDGHAESLTTPFYSATGKPEDMDNIYTYGTADKQGIIGSSTGGDDAVLLPTAQMK